MDEPPDSPDSSVPPVPTDAPPPPPPGPTYALPPPPPEPPKRRRKAWLIGIIVGSVGMLVALAVIGYLITSRGSEVLLEEDFASGEHEFSSDSDRFVDLSVVDGAYRILIKDASHPQIVRANFGLSHDGLRFEATVTQVVADKDWVFSVGCWTGQSGYLFLMDSSGKVAIAETVNESTGEGRLLTDLAPTDATRSPDQPNRLRIDCVGGGREPTIVSGWVNGEPVVSVAVPDGYDSFSLVGFFVVSEADGAEFRVDDVVAAAERPPPATSPVLPVTGSPTGSSTPSPSPGSSLSPEPPPVGRALVRGEFKPEVGLVTRRGFGALLDLKLKPSCEQGPCEVRGHVIIGAIHGKIDRPVAFTVKGTTYSTTFGYSQDCSGVVIGVGVVLQPVDVEIEFTVADAELIDGVWRATKLKARAASRAQEGGSIAQGLICRAFGIRDHPKLVLTPGSH